MIQGIASVDSIGSPRVSAGNDGSEITCVQCTCIMHRCTLHTFDEYQQRAFILLLAVAIMVVRYYKSKGRRSVTRKFVDSG
jgi:heterodisulfide reductase subunit C